MQIANMEEMMGAAWEMMGAAWEIDVNNTSGKPCKWSTPLHTIDSHSTIYE